MQTVKRVVKNIAKSLSRFVHPPLIYGPAYRATLRGLESLRIDSLDELEKLERAKLGGLFETISRQVPAYRDLDVFSEKWRRRDVTELLYDLPLVTKVDLQADVDRYTLTSLAKNRRVYLTTGGSTALPMGFYDAKRISTAVEAAYIHFLWSQTGYKPTSRSAVFRGSVVSTHSDKNKQNSAGPKKRLWMSDPFRRSMIFSSYHLQGDDLDQIYQRLLSFDPPYIQAYPSAANMLAAYIEESGQPAPINLKALLLGSETLPLWQRQRIERAFGAPVYSWYGHAEKAALAGERFGHSQLHVIPGYGYIYLRADDGSIITASDTPGEIITTGFTNQGTQFVNYRTGDIGLWSAEAYGKLGNMQTRVLQRVEGRAQELALTGDGRRISMCAINMHSGIFDAVRQFRFVQRRAGEIEMHIVAKNSFTENDERKILQGVSEKFGADMKLTIEHVTELPTTSRGKARFLVQHLDLEL